VETDALVAVAGATGYIGKRLTTSLIQRGIHVRALGRRHATLQTLVAQGATAAVVDVADLRSSRKALTGVDVAYYLVHSMDAGADFAERDRHAARTFQQAAREAGVRRIIYLGGLGEPHPGLSKHLASRLEVARILEEGPVPTTVLRAGVIVGGGSASYLMIQDLVNHLPVMLCPRWVHTACQPIAVDDALAYLVGCLDEPGTTGQRFDIGGPDIMSYRGMMETYARVTHRTRLILPVPVLTPRLSSYWVGFVTSVPIAVARPLIEGVRSPAVCTEQRITALFPRDLQHYDDAIRSIVRGTANA